MKEARAALARSAGLLGAPVPKTDAGMVIGLAKEVLLQVAHRMLPTRLYVRDTLRAQKALLASCATSGCRTSSSSRIERCRFCTRRCGASIWRRRRRPRRSLRAPTAPSVTASAWCRSTARTFLRTRVPRGGRSSRAARAPGRALGLGDYGVLVFIEGRVRYLCRALSEGSTASSVDRTFVPLARVLDALVDGLLPHGTVRRGRGTARDHPRACDPDRERTRHGLGVPGHRGARAAARCAGRGRRDASTRASA